MITFAYSGTFRVYHDTELGRWDNELIDSNHVFNRAQCDIDEDISIMERQFEFPTIEGTYHVWATGTITSHQDYWGEWDGDTAISALVIEKIDELDPEDTNFMDIFTEEKA